MELERDGVGMRGGRFDLLAGCQLVAFKRGEVMRRIRGGSGSERKIRKRRARGSDVREKKEWRPYMRLVRIPLFPNH